MAKPDYYIYWDAMAPLRAARPRSVPLPMKLVDCEIPKLAPDGPGRTLPWFTLDADAAALRTHVFPAQFFRWCQEYVWVALQNRPPKTASAKARVFWALDVWTRVVQGLLALNIPIDPFEGCILTESGACVVPPTALSSLFFNYYAPMQALHKAPAPRVDHGIVAPAPFFDLPWNWLRRQPALAKHLYALTPWTDVFELPRKNNADAGDLKGADAPTRAAIFQWRLWTMQELEKFAHPREAWLPTGINPGTATTWTGLSKAAAYDRYWPHRMGTRSNSGSLLDYVRAIERETTAATVIADTPWYFPSFAWSYSVGVPALVNYLRQLDYDGELQARMQAWMVLAVPRVDSRGKALPDKPQPVTCTDYRLAYEGKSGEIKKNAEDAAGRAAGLAAASPKVAAQMASQVAGALQKVSVALAALETVGGTAALAGALGSAGAALGTMAAALASAGPFAAVSGALSAGIAWVLMKIGGVAVGHVYIPIISIPQPFVRTLKSSDYKTQATGSSADVLLRVVNAFVNIEKATGFDLGFVFKPMLSVSASIRFQRARALNEALEAAAAALLQQSLAVQEAIREGRLAPPTREPPPTPPTQERPPTVVVEGTPGGVLVRAFAFTGNPFRLFSRERRT